MGGVELSEVASANLIFDVEIEKLSADVFLHVEMIEMVVCEQENSQWVA